jgi:hypothetical protein
MKTISDAIHVGYVGLLLFSDSDARTREILPLSAASIDLDVLEWSHAMASTCKGRPIGASLVRSLSVSAAPDERGEFPLWGESLDLTSHKLDASD